MDRVVETPSDVLGRAIATKQINSDDGTSGCVGLCGNFAVRRLDAVLFGKEDKVPILPKTKKKLEKKRLGPLLGTLIVYQQPKDRYAKEFMTRSAWSRRIGARGNLPVLLDGRLVRPSSRRRSVRLSEKVAESLESSVSTPRL